VKRYRHRVLVVDDDPDIRMLIMDILEGDDYEVYPFATGEQALSALQRHRFDVILADIKMPRISGLDLLDYVHDKDMDTKVILITAYASVRTAIQAVRGEAFDYLTKPFSLKELRQRVRQAVQGRQPVSRRSGTAVYRDLSIDLNARRVRKGENEVKLTRLEFDLLAYLFECQGCAVQVEELLREVWGCQEPDERTPATVKSCVSRLRRKIGDNARQPRYIQNVWGVGYQLGD
jgi:DNA-binding response OmpR family regulator